MGPWETLLGFSQPPLEWSCPMKVLKYAVLLFAVLAGAAAAQAGNDPDDCHTKTVHGIWDCR